MKEAGGRMFVGGSFTKVTNNTGGSINRKFLAAFDLNTGAWISSCKPTLNGRVCDMDVSSDGGLLIAGDFTQVNGNPVASGLAKLNPSTCQLNTNFRVRITKDGGRGMVRTIDLLGDRLFLGGQFNGVAVNGGRVAPAPNTYEVNAISGQVGGWRPQTNGTVFDINASERGDRVYIAGWFTKINGVAGEPYATRSSDGAPLTGPVPRSSCPRPEGPASGRSGWPGRYGARCARTPTGPTPGPPPPCGMQKVLCRLRWDTSEPHLPGLATPTLSLIHISEPTRPY